MNIASELQQFSVPIDSVRPHPENARQGDVGALCESLERNGQYQAIEYRRETGEIVVGNHRWKAAKALGWTHIAAVPLDISEIQARRILLVDNRTSDLATYDTTQLLATISRMDTLDGTGFDLDDLEEIIKDASEPLDLQDQFSATIQFDDREQYEAFRKKQRYLRRESIGAWIARKIDEE